MGKHDGARRRNETSRRIGEQRHDTSDGARSEMGERGGGKQDEGDETQGAAGETHHAAANTG